MNKIQSLFSQEPFKYLRDYIDSLDAINNINDIAVASRKVLDELWTVNTIKNRRTHTPLTVILNDNNTTETFIITTITKCKVNEIHTKQKSLNPLNLLHLYRNIKSEEGFWAFLFLCQKIKHLTCSPYFIWFYERIPGQEFFEYVDLIDEEHKTEKELLLAAAETINWERTDPKDYNRREEILKEIFNEANEEIYEEICKA